MLHPVFRYWIVIRHTLLCGEDIGNVQRKATFCKLIYIRFQKISESLTELKEGVISEN
jgi:hypothetical protein